MSAVMWPSCPPISRSTYSGGRAMVMPLVMVKARGAICQSVTQVWLKRRTWPMSVRPPPPAQFSKIVSGKRARSRS